MDTIIEEHCCQDIENYPLDKFFQKGEGKGLKVLIVGESPAENGWRKSGKAFYTPEGKLLATGKRLNENLVDFGLRVETCGFTELSKCFIGKNRKILGECCRKCWPIFEKQIKLGEYKLIIILGVVTTKIFGEMVKKELKMGEMKEVIIGNNIYQILPIFHPSPVNPWGREKNKKIFELNNEKITNILG